ncbi:MAG: iron donor protein CyaY [Bacteroidota bacterium]|nr:iron donor protein CyaY [Bacteroidota bacterium]MDP4229168.1 iron donor protein CyaY [Bacteroidota bacterium]MDP4237630.1 iron donor protein CyaY [Bacteroidota bacterium]
MGSFTKNYDVTINKLDDQLSDLIDSGLDFELEKNGDVLTISFEDGTKFIVSPNSPVSQLWVSANYEGHRFNYNPETGLWSDEKSGELFSAYISRLLSQKLDTEIHIS